MLAISNREAFGIFCMAATIKLNPDCCTNDFIRTSTYSSDTIFRYLKKFGDIIKKEGYPNKYTYIEPSDHYIVIDSSILDTEVDREVIGNLIRLKCCTRINTNIVDISQRKLKKEFTIQRQSIIDAQNANLLEVKDRCIILKHPSLTEI